MTPGLRKLGLTFHVVLSVGWIGAVAAFMALAIGTFSKDAAVAHAAYLTMAVVGRGVLVPLSVGALVSGIVQSLATKWGLFRHYWVLVKLALTLFATAALLVHQATAITEAARLARDASGVLLRSAQLQQLGVQLLADSGLALLVLLTATAIGVYKPWGKICQITKSLRVFIAGVTALVVAFVVLHLSGHGMHRHSH
jgi:hypothetical protein